MKPGDLVKISPRPFLGRRETIGMILKYDNEDPIGIVPAKVIVLGHVTYVGKEYIKPLRKNAHVSKNKK